MEIEIIDVISNRALSVKTKCTAAELPKIYPEVYTEIVKVINEQNLKSPSAPLGIYHSFSPENVDVEPAIPVSGDAKATGRVQLIDTYGGKAARAKFIGPYEKLGEAWDEFSKWMTDNGYKVGFPCFEIYITDPGSEPDSSKWQTDLYFPVS